MYILTTFTLYSTIHILEKNKILYVNYIMNKYNLNDINFSIGELPMFIHDKFFESINFYKYTCNMPSVIYYNKLLNSYVLFSLHL